MLKKLLFPGTFNPPSLGHKDLIERASRLCERLYVGIAVNINKPNGLFSVSEREAMLKSISKELPNVEVVSFSGLVVDFVEEHEIDAVVRGLRAITDYDFEMQMALANRKMVGVETLFLVANERFSHITSTIVREIGMNGRSLANFIPHEIEEIVRDRFSQN